MKLEKLFEAKDNCLFKIDGTALSVNSSMIKAVSWRSIEAESDVYDEAFLAALRDELKGLESAGKFVVIEPVIDKALSDEAAFEACIAAMKHCARRIKDCVSVIGFALPAAFVQSGFSADSQAAAFMSELSAKHGHYLFFCKKTDAGGETGVPADIVLY